MNATRDSERTEVSGNRAETPSAVRQLLIALLLLGVVAGISGAGALANIGNVDSWYESVEKVPWNPPSSVFAPAWTTLYLMNAVAGFLLWRSGYRGRGTPNRAREALWLFAAQLALNAAWSPTFFAGTPLVGEAAWWIAAAVILALIVCVGWLIPVAARWSRIAAVLFVPYLLWLVFAATLNIGIIVLN